MDIKNQRKKIIKNYNVIANVLLFKCKDNSYNRYFYLLDDKDIYII